LQTAAPDWTLAVRRLIEEANQRGGPDNISAILAALEPG
jgi:serine/threonine protein phosphatase PrpC